VTYSLAALFCLAIAAVTPKGSGVA
jgi:hypothetical protein